VINLIKWVRYGKSSDDVVRFITKNIQANDVIIFHALGDYAFSKREIISNIQSQCGTGFPCPFSVSQIITVEENIFCTDGEIDLEYLHNKNPDNIVLFGFDRFEPETLRSIICDFATTTEILGISTLRDKNFVNVLSAIADHKKNGLDEDRIRLIMTLENKYHRDIINMAFASFYSDENCKVSEYQVLDHVSELWYKQNPEQM